MKLSRRQFVLAGAAIVASCSSDRGRSKANGFVYDGKTETLDINGQRGLLMVPTKQNGHAIVYHHGAGEDETAPTAEALKADLVHQLLGAGLRSRRVRPTATTGATSPRCRTTRC